MKNDPIICESCLCANHPGLNKCEYCGDPLKSTRTEPPKKQKCELGRHRIFHQYGGPEIKSSRFPNNDKNKTEITFDLPRDNHFALEITDGMDLDDLKAQLINAAKFIEHIQKGGNAP